jgi:hypothetical protein
MLLVPSLLGNRTFVPANIEYRIQNNAVAWKISHAASLQ